MAILGRIWLHCDPPQPNKVIRIQVLVVLTKELGVSGNIIQKYNSGDFQKFVCLFQGFLVIVCLLPDQRDRICRAPCGSTLGCRTFDPVCNTIVVILGRIWLHCDTPQPNKVIRIQVLVWALISKEIAPRDHPSLLWLASALHTFSLPMAQ